MKDKYFPLDCINKFENIDMWDGVKLPSLAELRTLVEERSESLMKQYSLKYRDFAPYFTAMVDYNMKTFKNDMKFAVDEAINDFSMITIVMNWAKNKQVFKFDADFLDELINTDGLKLVKDHFSHLPFECFYADVSDNKEICKSINGDGFFVKPYKRIKDGEDVFYIDLVKTDSNRGYIYRDTLYFPNKDTFEPYEEFIDNSVVFNDKKKELFSEKFNKSLYRLIVGQILTYLASDEKDIRENNITKNTYKKPDPNRIKNKFSEVRIQDVGVRFGTAVRNWNKSRDTAASSGASGVAKRPHYRRAHWHTYCYGKNHAERKLVWQHELAINMDLGTDNSVVIHKASKQVENEFN